MADIEGVTFSYAFENRVLRGELAPKRIEIKGSGENYIMRSLMVCSPNPMFFGNEI